MRRRLKHELQEGPVMSPAAGVAPVVAAMEPQNEALALLNHGPRKGLDDERRFQALGSWSRPELQPQHCSGPATSIWWLGTSFLVGHSQCPMAGLAPARTDASLGGRLGSKRALPDQSRHGTADGLNWTNTSRRELSHAPPGPRARGSNSKLAFILSSSLILVTLLISLQQFGFLLFIPARGVMCQPAAAPQPEPAAPHGGDTPRAAALGADDQATSSRHNQRRWAPMEPRPGPDGGSLFGSLFGFGASAGTSTSPPASSGSGANADTNNNINNDDDGDNQAGRKFSGSAGPAEGHMQMAAEPALANEERAPQEQQAIASGIGNQAAQSNYNDATHMSYRSGQTSDKVTLPGDILLGGLFPIHMKGTKIECGQINRDRGIQRLEAMLYALDKINEDESLLPDIKLGAILLDSCSSSTYALNQSLEFIRASINTVESSAFECKDKSTPRPKYGSKMIAGVIGGSYSEVSLQVANLLRLFRIPQVSYASTGTALSDKTLYDLFARTVPSDMFQARAIADIVLKLNWSYVSLVSSEGLYGDSGSREFIKQASNRRICIATHEKISPTIGEQAYDAIVQNLQKRNATGVVLFTRAEDSRELLLAVKRAKLFHNFAWVAADGWGTHQKLIEGVEDVAWGAITVELQAKAIPGFDNYMKALTPWANGRNPWFSEYWQEWFDCQLQANLVQQQRLASGAPYRRQAPLLVAAPGGSRSRRGAGPSSAPEPAGRAGSAASGCPTDSATMTTSRAEPADAVPGNSSSRAQGPAVARPSCSSRPVESRPALSSSSSSSSTLQVPVGGHADQIAEQHLHQQHKEPARPDTATPRGSNRPKRATIELLDESGEPVKQFCSPNLRISESNGYRQEQKVQFVVDAVYAMAHALHKAWVHLCNAQPGVVCEALKELNGGDFYNKYLLNVSFKDLAGSEVKFDERGDGLGRYNIYNFRQVKQQSLVMPKSELASVSSVGGALTINDSLAALDELGGGSPDAAPIDKLGNVLSSSAYEQKKSIAGGDQTIIVEHFYTSGVEFEYSTVGRWTEDDYNLALDDLQFFQGDRVVPESFCSKPCELGQAKIMRAGDHCCWICKTCQPYEYLPDEFSCLDCGIGRWPMPNKTSCYDLPQKYLRWDSAFSLLSLSISCLGIAFTLFVIIIFMKYLDTPVVKASGRELSFILLAGIACCHSSTFVLLSKPTIFICGTQRFLVNFGFALMYASLLVKTNRISRIFNCARKSAKRPSFISPKSQMLITGILVAIQIFLTIVWFVFEPPGIRADSPEGKRDEVILKCRAKGKSFIISLVYNMVLITTCTVYAVKTRKIPENFNESKFIGFTMYTTIVIWLAFVTMFFGTNNSYEIQINTMCICISLSAYVTLICLFSPKISIIIFHPDKNVRKLTMNSATYKRAFKPVSSVASVDGRNNLASGGPQPDAASGGPMSTTSNVLNLAESQNARLQESSIVSNVVNSNSAGSNCSQKTPTTLSQQLALVGVCSNCGAHQLSSMPTTSKLALDQLNTANLSSDARSRAANNTNGAKNSSKFNTTSITNQILVSTSLAANVGASLGQSSILMSSTLNEGTRSRQSTQAKVLHNRLPAAVSSRAISSSDVAPTLSGTMATTSATSTHPPGKQTTQDDQVQFSGVYHHNRHQSQQQQDSNPDGDATLAGQQKVSAAGKKHIASLNRLNEMTSVTSSDQHGIDDSTSSLANDSFINTSQENTPCINGDNGASVGQNQCKGSDSMLCNQSVQSMDYCSSCCPSLCHCSCPVCSSIGVGVDENGVNTQCNHAHSTGALRIEDGPEGRAGDYEAMCFLQLGRHRDDCDIVSSSTNYRADTSLAGSIRRRRSEESPGATKGGVGLRANVLDRSKISQARTDNILRLMAYDGGEDCGTSGARRSQTMEMSTLINPKHRHQQHQPAGAIAHCALDPTYEQDSETSTMILKSHSHERDRKISSASGRSVVQPTKGSSMTGMPIVYALKAAANSAIGAAGAQISLASGSLCDEHEDFRYEYEDYIDDDGLNNDEKRQQQRYHRKADENYQPVKSHLSTSRGSHSSKTQALEQPTTLVSRSGSSGFADSASACAGTIQASLELVKSAEAKRKNQSASSSSRQRRKSSSCFNYHDEYEYSYGFAQSDSDESEADEETPTDTSLSRACAKGIRPCSEYEPCYDADDLNHGHDAGDEDDFDHDGRVTLDRRDSARTRPRRTSSDRSRNRQMLGRVGKELDKHRINSVALITATLSTGGAIVDSSGAAGSSSFTDPSNQLESGARRENSIGVSSASTKRNYDASQVEAQVHSEEYQLHQQEQPSESSTTETGSKKPHSSDKISYLGRL